MRWAWLLGLLVVTAGCIGGAGEDVLTPQEVQQLDDEETKQVERTLVFEQEVEASAGEGRIEAVEWQAPLGPSLTAFEVELAWETEAHSFGLDVEGPIEEEIAPENDPTQAELDAEFPGAEPGSYTFYPTRDGVIVSDSLTLTVTATFLVPEGESLSVGGCTGIHVRQTTDGWRASFSCQASGPASPAKQVDADTVNGEVLVDGSSNEALATVDAWARGSSEDQARQRAQAIDVTVRVIADEIVARAEAPDWEDRGADVDIGVPQATLSGQADTTNGPIDFTDVATDGITADTTNGAILGDLEASGDVDLDTTNGPIQVDLTPRDDLHLQTDTTNGQIDLGLTETNRIAYTIDASTTNGQITESMDEAHLEGSDDDATLVTENGADRPIQVTGGSDTTNGNIHFEGR